MPFSFPRHQKAWLYLATLAVLGSGLVWQYLETYTTQKDEFDALTKHPAEVWMLRAHGAGAMLMLVVLGALLPVHVKRAWQARKNLLSGVLLLALLAALTLTGYALYYVGDEGWRARASSLHWWLGLGLPLLLAAHVIRGHWLRRHGRLRLAPPLEDAPAGDESEG